MNVVVVYDLLSQIVKRFRKNAMFLFFIRNIDLDQNLDFPVCFL